MTQYADTKRRYTRMDVVKAAAAIVLEIGGAAQNIAVADMMAEDVWVLQVGVSLLSWRHEKVGEWWCLVYNVDCEMWSEGWRPGYIYLSVGRAGDDVDWRAESGAVAWISPEDGPNVRGVSHQNSWLME